MDFEIKQLRPSDLESMNALLDCFAEVFEDSETYCENRPDATYMENLLNSETFVAIIAQIGDEVIGGLAAYELKKFEQNRSELYLYDLAVSKNYRRRGVATALIEKLTHIADERGAWVVFVQADYEDEAAVKLYSKLGVREEVLHFDISVKRIEKAVILSHKHVTFPRRRTS